MFLIAIIFQNDGLLLLQVLHLIVQAASITKLLSYLAWIVLADYTVLLLMVHLIRLLLALG